MKYHFLLMLLCYAPFGFSQATHSVLVAVNQPEQCIVLNNNDHTGLNINVYPNPAGQNLIITSEYIIDEVSILDSTGRIVYSRKQKGNQFSLDVSRYNRGMYHCIIKHSAGINRAKIILQ